jgi:hypothetical protein
MKGYVWGGLISMVNLSFKSEGKKYQVLTGITEYSKNTAFAGEIRIAHKNKIISSAKYRPLYTSFDASTMYRYSVKGTVSGNRGIKKVKNIIVLHFEYPACGYENGDILFLFDGKTVHYGINAPYVADAGVFHMTTKLIFPSDSSGVKNRLIVEEIGESFDDEKSKYVETQRERKYYQWTGKKFVIVKK